MSNMSKQEIIDEMVSEGYDYNTAWRFIYGDIANSNDKEQEMKHRTAKNIVSNNAASASISTNATEQAYVTATAVGAILPTAKIIQNLVQGENKRWQTSSN